MTDDDGGYEVGKNKPPKWTRFGKGVTGNPTGRPRGKHEQLPYEDVLGQQITITENGVSRTVRVDEAFMLYLINKSLSDGSPAMRRHALRVVERRQVARAQHQKPNLFVFATYDCAGQIDSVASRLRMMRLADSLRSSARWRLEPWIVQSALDRLGPQQLTIDEQQIVYAATRAHHEVRWPDWWTST